MRCDLVGHLLELSAEVAQLARPSCSKVATRVWELVRVKVSGTGEAGCFHGVGGLSRLRMSRLWDSTVGRTLLPKGTGYITLSRGKLLAEKACAV